MSEQTLQGTVPRQIGRYEIVGPLASGGMAEIFLARLMGPSGFMRPVVIKRILPHLARKKDFVDMFLDEARIVAGIRHPNVVQVTELGHESGELFLAMEYLEGESTSGLMRRMLVRGERLDLTLAAYIVAEACAGVHAAHELTDENGKKLNIVHRDVTPHNVFIGYKGAIKVLDFGIATASNRIAQTEAGQFKGKLEYASPEQCKGAVLDRRSDVFALGAILWELTTGKRLFKRASPLEMQRAICEQPIPPPSAVAGDVPYPDDLAAITMKALARKRRERYQTALELRHDLLVAMRKLSARVAPEEDLSVVMHRLFEDRIEEKAEMLRRVKAGASVPKLPIGEADELVEIPVAVNVEYTSVPPDGVGTDTGSLSTSEGEAIPAAPPAPSSPDFDGAAGVPPRGVTSLRAPVIIGGAVLALIGVVLTLVALAARSRPPPVAIKAVDAGGLASQGLTSTPSASASVAVAPSGAPSSGPSASAAPSASVAAPGKVVLHIETVPSKAIVLVNGAKQGVSPTDLRLDQSDEAVTIEIRHGGYVTVKERIVPDVNQKLRLTLVPAQGPAATATPFHRFD
jgi:eukaryotic-like serine/threonine-protein kinase